MKTFRAWQLVTFAASALVACSSPAARVDERVSSTSSALTTGLGRPVPFDTVAQMSTWDGNDVELIMADALSTCATYTDTGTVVTDDLFADLDPELSRVLVMMNSTVARSAPTYPTGATCQSHANLTASALQNWRLIRNTPTCNAVADTTVQGSPDPRSANLSPAAGVFLSSALVDGNNLTKGKVLRAYLRPRVNACIAQTLRDAFPGTAAPEALLLPGYEIRQVVDEGRQRAQQAILGFAKLHAIASTPVALATLQSKSAASTSMTYLASLRNFINRTESGSQPQFTGMANDELSALGLLASFAEDEQHLLHRDSAAMTPRGTASDQTSVADVVWGPASWMQRSSALQFGGFPLATLGPATSSTLSAAPWQPTAYDSVSESLWFDWPHYEESAWVRSVVEPKASLLYAEASRLNQLMLPAVFDTSGNTPNLVVDDSPAAANGFYVLVENALRIDECKPSESCLPALATNTDPSSTFTTYQLWARLGFAPADARATLRYAKEQIGNVSQRAETASMVRGTVTGSCSGTVPASWQYCIGLSQSTRFQPRDELSDAAVYARNSEASLFMPSEIPFGASTTIYDDASLFLGMPPGEASPGTNASLTFMRQSLLETYASFATPGSAAPANWQSLYAYARDVLGIASARVGDVGVVLRPQVVPGGAWGGPRSVVDATGEQWQLDVVVPQSDPFWQGTVTVYTLQDVYSNQIVPHVADLARMNDPSISVFNLTLAQSLLSAQTSKPAAVTSASALLSMAPTPLAWYRAPIVFAKVDFGNGVPVVPVAQRTVIAASQTASGTTYRVLVDGFRPRYDYQAQADIPKTGYFHSTGGSFGAAWSLQHARAARDPSRPAMDPFGVSTTWTPPNNPALYAASGDGDPASYYLSRAESAATEATGLIQAGVNAAIDASRDAALQDAERRKQLGVTQDLTRQLCGSNAMSLCDTSTTIVVLSQGLTPYAPMNGTADPFLGYTSADAVARALPGSLQSTNDPTKAGQNLDVLGWAYWHLMQLRVPLSSAVAATITSPLPPTFSDYSGGKLQSTYLTQWQAINAFRQSWSTFVAALQAANAAYKVALKGNALAQTTYDKCISDQTSFLSFLKSFVETVGCITAIAAVDAASAGAATAAAVPAAVAACGAVAVDMTSRAEGPNDECKVQLAQMSVAQAEAVETVASSQLTLQDRSVGFVQALGAIGQSVAAVAQDVEATKSAIAEQQLEADALYAGLMTTNGLYKSFHQYDLWRAAAAAEDARRYGVLALRAIESKYVESLEQTTTDQALVANPSQWATNIYGYDLSLVQTIGTTTPSASDGTGAIAPNVLQDYAENLRRYVDGYPVQHPSSLGTANGLVGFDGPGALDGHTPPGPTYGASRWEYYCAATSAWVNLSSAPTTFDPSTVCSGGRPTIARLVFTLTEQGTATSSGESTQQFNQRWSQLAVNLVGTGVRNCGLAVDPMGCYTDAAINGRLSQRGGAWVQNYAGQQALLDTAPVTIDALKLLAAEEVLDPVSRGFQEPFVQQIARADFRDRPFQGEYALEIDVGPELVLEQIEAVQLLTQGSFWERNQ